MKKIKLFANWYITHLYRLGLFIIKPKLTKQEVDFYCDSYMSTDFEGSLILAHMCYVMMFISVILIIIILYGIVC